jgi:aryl-alcohol dehydrogenase-like predicted oxidoreductase
MHALVQEGKIRHFGVSNETPWGLMHYIATAETMGLHGPVTIQSAYSLLNRTFEVGLAEISWREHVPLLAYSPLAYGLLTGKYHNNSDVSRSRLKLFPQLNRYSNEKSYEAAKKYVSLATQFGFRPAQMALAFILSRPYVATCIVGATQMDQLEENIASSDMELPGELLKAIDKIHQDISNPAP